MAGKKQGMDVNELIRAYGTEASTSISRSQVNRYLREGLLPPPEEGDLFGEHHLERLRMIDHLRSRYGMSLKDISGLFGVIVATGGGEVAGEPEERQVVDRKQRIIENATDLFAAKGYHGTTIDEIVQATGIAKGTFYIYFDSKEELLLEVIKRLIDTTFHKIDRLLQKEKKKDVVTSIELKGQGFLELYVEKSEILYMLIGETVGNPRLKGQLREVYEQLAETIEEDLRAGVECGEIHSYTDLKTIAYALIGMGQTLAILLSVSDKPQNEKSRKTVHELMQRALNKRN
jgi:AcrR family transcriptional regulator